MSILSDAVKQGPPKPAPTHRCAVGAWLATLTDQDRADAKAILARDSGWQHADVTDLLMSLEPAVPNLTKSSVPNHRRGDCACERA